MEDGKYFVTVRLKGAIPRTGRDRIRQKSEELRNANRNNEDEVLRIQRLVFKEMEYWLHRSKNVRHLQHENVAEMVTEAITHRQKDGVWNMFEHVIMPNHLHLFFETGDGHIKRVMENFKRWTAMQANQLLDRIGRFRQIEWFDHWSRSDEESEKIVHYIRRNPYRAGLVKADESWPYVRDACQT